MACCGAKGHLRTSKNGLKHFYHANKNDECSGEPESLEHLKLKYQICQICKSEGWWVQPEYQSPTGDWRADVFATKGERKIAFEVQLSIISLADLQDREQKYLRDGIESYWILKDFLRINPNDDSKVVSDNRNVCISDYLNYEEFILSRERLLLIHHGIRSIGINLQNGCLYTSDILGIEISDGIKSILKGDYEKNIMDFEIKFQRKTKLKDIAEPELNELSNIGFRRFEYENEMKKVYAIFKNNKWEDRPSLQEEIREIYSTFDTFKKAYGKIFSPKNGFVWKDYMGFGRAEPILNLISEEQITNIHNQILDVKNDEKKFLSVFNVVKDYVERKDAENDKIIQLFCGTNPEYDNPIQFRKKKLESQNMNQKSIGKTIESKSQEIPLIKGKKQETRLFFKFIPVLPTLAIESQRGWKYHNPAGCTWEINHDDAIEFEKKGYGNIVQK